MLKVNILSAGRFHVLDLARELDKNGFDVKFYSFVPVRRAAKFGLPTRCSKSMIALMAPFLFLQRILFRNSEWAKRLFIVVEDYVTAWYMRKCDVCIAMSGNFLHSLERAKRQGAIVVLERGSKHILEQKCILESIPSLKRKKLISEFFVNRELSGYDIADYVSIPSFHVKHSFIKHNITEDKLFLNPYGVDLTEFYPAKNVPKKYDLIYVGNWCYRKGCDLIVSAVKEMNLSLIHVGKIGDMDFPNEDHFTHVDSVEQSRLVDYYNQAKVFILPSREDGFGMVFSQALACNLPIIGSPDSGAPDLKKMIGYPEFISIIKDYTVDAVMESINVALEKYKEIGNKKYEGEALRLLSWEAYGKRYATFLKKIAING